MPQEYDNEMRGVLFKNDKQGNDKRPDMTGEVTVHGVTYRVAAWARDSKRGRLLSLALTEKESQGNLDTEAASAAVDDLLS